MYIKKLRLENIKCHREVEWELADDNLPGWHVVLGNNGAGKTSFLQAVAVAIDGVHTFYEFSSSQKEWITKKKNDARIYLSTISNENFDIKPHHDDHNSGNYYKSDIYFRHNKLIPLELYQIGVTDDGPFIKCMHRLPGNYPGWFIVGFGPFRRISNKITFEFPDKAPDFGDNSFRTLFSDSETIDSVIGWLIMLYLKKFEKDEKATRLLEGVTSLVNSEGFLPHGTKLKSISSKSITFIDGNGAELDITQLSDGFRSILSLTLELVRQMAYCYDFLEGGIFDETHTHITVPGVVLIDEVDAHLHPTWQKQIGFWFRRYFPNIQFIVTTHSPLVCQATVEGGSVFLLPTPGSEETGKFIEGEALKRLQYGDILDAYSTGAFGDGATRSDLANEKYQRFAKLNIREMKGKLTPEEERELKQLRDTLPLETHADIE